MIDDSQKNDSLVDVSDTGIDTSLIKPDADKVATLEGMILSLKFRYSEKTRKIWPTLVLFYKERFISNDFPTSLFLKKIKQQTSIFSKN